MSGSGRFKVSGRKQTQMAATMGKVPCRIVGKCSKYCLVINARLLRDEARPELNIIPASALDLENKKTLFK